MDKEYAATLRKLTPENRKILSKMGHYFETRYINEVTYEELMVDIAGMAYECQQRNQPFSDAIGDDYEKFCRELVRSSPRQSFIERFLNVMHWAIVLGLILVPLFYLAELILPNYMTGEIHGFTYYASLPQLIECYAFGFIAMIGWFFFKMYPYKPVKFLGSVCLIFSMLFFIGIKIVAGYYFSGKHISIHLIGWVVIFGGALVFCDVLKRLSAMTIAYNKKRKK